MKTPLQLLVLAVVAVAAGAGGWFAGRASNRYELLRAGPAGSWIARIDRSTGAMAIYDRARGAWFAVAEPNYFDKFDADKYLAQKWDPFKDGGAVEVAGKK